MSHAPPPEHLEKIRQRIEPHLGSGTITQMARRAGLRPRVMRQLLRLLNCEAPNLSPCGCRRYPPQGSTGRSAGTPKGLSLRVTAEPVRKLRQWILEARRRREKLPGAETLAERFGVSVSAAKLWLSATERESIEVPERD